jgi:uncharacterized membrane protein YhiD involved in acid resistance
MMRDALLVGLASDAIGLVVGVGTYAAAMVLTLAVERVRRSVSAL